jgi:hypothetical protein
MKSDLPPLLSNSFWLVCGKSLYPEIAGGGRKSLRKARFGKQWSDEALCQPGGGGGVCGGGAR